MRYFIKLGFVFTLLLLTPGAIHSQDDQNIEIIFLGASNTNTVEWTNGSYVTKLVDIGFPWDQLEIKNPSVDGTGAFTYYNDSDLLSTRLDDYSSDVFFVMLGGNDFLMGNLPATFERNLSYVLSSILNNTDDDLVFVANIIWSPISEFLPDETVKLFDDYQGIIANLTNYYNFYLVDLFNSTVNQSNYFQRDQIHLNEEGHKAVATTIHNQISSIIVSTYNITDLPDEENSLSNSEEANFYLITPLYIILVIYRKKMG